MTTLLSRTVFPTPRSTNPPHWREDGVNLLQSADRISPKDTVAVARGMGRGQSVFIAMHLACRAQPQPLSKCMGRGIIDPRIPPLVVSVILTLSPTCPFYGSTQTNLTIARRRGRNRTCLFETLERSRRPEIFPAASQNGTHYSTTVTTWLANLRQRGAESCPIAFRTNVAQCLFSFSISTASLIYSVHGAYLVYCRSGVRRTRKLRPAFIYL